ncbi:hypothetical protein H6778_02715 [Candidatus Nomurabacteria bacterium]|nr:hypothetical protein [Candidatus Nomurabacteria bacterium]
MSLNSSQFKAYLAGFLDGDGSIYVRAKPNSSYRYGYQIAPYVAFFQSATCESFLPMVGQIGYGKTRLRKDGIYEFTISKQDDIVDFLAKVSPYLLLKQEQAKLMLEILSLKKGISSEKDFKQLLNRIDTFRELNYSKKRKRRV